VALGRPLFALARRLALPLGALIVWGLGGTVIGGETTAFWLTETLLGIWALYRLLDTIAAQVARHLPSSRDAGFYEHVHRLLQFTAWWGAGWLLMDTAGYRPDVAALWSSAGHLVLVLGIFSLLVRRDRVLGLLPRWENRGYGTVVRLFSAFYLPLVYFSLLIALLWVAGYRNLAAVFLGRSWAVVGIGLLIFALYHLALRLLGRWLPEEPEREAIREEAMHASRRLLGAAAMLAALFLFFRVLGLLDAWESLLAPVWFRVGSIEVSGGSVWTSFLVLLAAGLFSRWLQAALNHRVYGRLGISVGEAYAVNRLLHYALLAGAMLLVLNTLGISPQSLALVAGGLSVGIGFGLQNIANNLASGLILLTSRQVRQGDVISVDNQMGKVREVNLRSTVVTTFDNVDLLIPNSKLLDGTLTNWTHGGTIIRTRINFGVAYSADPVQVLEIARSVATAHPEVLPEPEPQVWFREMADNSLNFEMYVWVDIAVTPRPRVISEILCALFERFHTEGVEIPFPQRDLHLRSGVPWEALLQALGRNGETPHADGNGRAPAGDGARPDEPAPGERVKGPKS
jgi:small-conductance mechanosensitive channel